MPEAPEHTSLDPMPMEPAPGGEDRAANLWSRFGFDRPDDEFLAGVRARTGPLSLGRLGGYELLSELGRGGQGIVYKARQPTTGRLVAVKRLAAGLFATPAMRTRFEREVDAMCRLVHPGIVTVHGVEI